MGVEKIDLEDKIAGPRGWELLRLGMLFQKNPLLAYDTLQADYGDMVYCPWPNRKCLFLFDPMAVKHVLKDNQTNYLKSAEYQHLKPLLGEGLLTSENEKWRKQRRIMAKEFHPASIDQYTPKIHQKITEALKNIETQQQTFDISLLFSSLTFQIAGDVFFGANVSDFSDKAREALEVEMERINKRMRRAINLPFIVPSPENCQGRNAIGSLNKVVKDIMGREKSEDSNVLQKLQNSTPPLKTKTIRDEVMTLLLAGHETTSNLLTWAIYGLCQHPQWQEHIRTELKYHQKQAANLTRTDFDKMVHLRAVVQETLRLYPSIPIFSRTAKEEDVILGHKVEAGVSVLISPWNIHRSSKYWSEPLAWKPERFLVNAAEKNDFTFIAFARGARSCIGEELAMIEAMMILAHLVEKNHWQLAPDFTPHATQHLTLKSENGMLVKKTLIAEHDQRRPKLKEWEERSKLKQNSSQF